MFRLSLKDAKDCVFSFLFSSSCHAPVPRLSLQRLSWSQCKSQSCKTPNKSLGLGFDDQTSTQKVSVLFLIAKTSIWNIQPNLRNQSFLLVQNNSQYTSIPNTIYQTTLIWQMSIADQHFAFEVLPNCRETCRGPCDPSYWSITPGTRAARQESPQKTI